MSRAILKYPEPLLRGRAAELKEIDGRIKELSELLIETLARVGGYGLAAPQIGESLRLIIIDIGEHFRILVNPEVVEVDEEHKVLFPEGCLSIPGVEAQVWRPQRALVRGYTLEEQEIELEPEDLVARVLLHEIDHLDGILYIDHLGAAKRTTLLKEYERLRRDGQERQVTSTF